MGELLKPNQLWSLPESQSSAASDGSTRLNWTPLQNLPESLATSKAKQNY